MGILCGKSYAQGLSTDNKWLVLHRKHTCKKSNPQSDDFLCIPSPNYWYIYIFYPQTQEEIYWFLRVFHLCISGVENFFDNCVFLFFLFVDCVDNCN